MLGLSERDLSMNKLLNVSDVVLSEIINNLPNIKIFEYVAHKCQIINKEFRDVAHRNFINAYKSISDPLWPEIFSIDDFYSLPDNIKLECIEIHKFSPEIWYDPNITFQSWQSNSSNWYPKIDALVRYKKIVLDNRKYIQGKKVIDIACGAGEIALAMTSCQPNFSTLVDIRPSVIVAKEALDILGMESNSCAIQSDLHDYQSNTKICKGHDTVFLCGYMYHTHDHFLLLESICKSFPETIIIESVQHPLIQDLADSLIFFKAEQTELMFKGWQHNRSEILVGCPNIAWFDHAMDLLGYDRIAPVEIFSHWGDKEAPHPRSIHIYGIKK